jgi:peroxiredoxin
MKTSTYSLFVSILLILYSCSQNPKPSDTKFTLNGLIDQDTGTIVLRYAPETSWKFDTTQIINGKFRFQGEIKEPLRATILKGKERADFYIEPGIIKITLNNGSFSDIKISGSKAQIEEEMLNEMVKPVYANLDHWKLRGKNVSDSLKIINDKNLKKKLEDELINIDHQWSIARSDLDKTWLKFVLMNPKSYVSPYYLSILISNDVLQLDSMKLVFNSLDTAIQNSKYGKIINETIRKKENIQVGKLAPEFKANDINNEVITLSQFKNKSVVLLDFWASWCVPCRESIPYLKSLYKTYHSQGFEIISITIDMNKDAWLKAIKEEGIDIWYNIPVAEKYSLGPSFFTKDDVYSNYDVGAVPTYLLINKEGKIVGHWTGLSDENEKLLKDQISGLLTK